MIVYGLFKDVFSCKLPDNRLVIWEWFERPFEIAWVTILPYGTYKAPLKVAFYIGKPESIFFSSFIKQKVLRGPEI